MTLTGFLVILVIAIAIVGIYWFARKSGLIESPDGAPTANGKMSQTQIRTIVGYLIVLGFVLVIMEVSLLAVDFPITPPITEVAGVPIPTPTPAPPPKETTDQPQANGVATVPARSTENSEEPKETKVYPRIHYVLPQTTITPTQSMSVMVYGSNFPDEPKVRLNMVAVTPDKLADNLLKADVSPEQLVGRGSLTIDVVGTNADPSNAVIVPILQPTAKLNLLLWQGTINRELQLLLVVVFAGALGSFIHILKSATAYIGNGTMKASWFWWYITGPFVGIAMALIFYAVLRGGFLAGTPADEKVVNPFGVVVVGALVGMFSDKASLKLAELFDTLFRSGDPRTGKLQAPVITSITPNTVSAGQSTPQTFKIIGERLGKVSAIRFNSTEVPATVLSDSEVEFTLQPEHLATAGTLQVVAVDPQSGTSTSATLTIEAVGQAGAPQITAPASLPPATVNTAYSETVEGTCDPLPCNWSINPGAPAWLIIDATTGELSGTPDAVGKFPVTIKLENGNGQSAEKTYELVVT